MGGGGLHATGVLTRWCGPVLFMQLDTLWVSQSVLQKWDRGGQKKLRNPNWFQVSAATYNAYPNVSIVSQEGNLQLNLLHQGQNPPSCRKRLFRDMCPHPRARRYLEEWKSRASIQPSTMVPMRCMQISTPGSRRHPRGKGCSEIRQDYSWLQCPSACKAGFGRVQPGRWHLG